MPVETSRTRSTAGTRRRISSARAVSPGVGAPNDSPRAADDAVYARLDATAATLSAEVSAAFTAAGVAHRVQHAGNLFSVLFGPDAAERGVQDYAAAQAQETYRYAPFFHAMLDQGVSQPPSVFEAWFVSAAHDDAALDRIVSALPAAVRAAAAATA